MKAGWILAAALVLAAPAVAVAQECASCTAAKVDDGWCSDCKVGTIGGEQTKCKSCFDIRTSDESGWCADCGVGYARGVKTQCKSCLAAIGADEWCADCRVGYANAQKTTCKGCFGLMKAKDGGWCEDCGVGHAKGLKTKCKSCLGAIQADGWCEDCKVGYANAQKTTCKGCFGMMKAKDGGWCADCNVGHAKGLKTKCKNCFDAIAKNGSCPDCKRSFKDAVASKMTALHVHDLDQAKVKGAIEKLDGVTNIRFDGEKVMFDLKESSKTKVKHVIAALDEAGFDAHAGDH